MSEAAAGSTAPQPEQELDADTPPTQQQQQPQPLDEQPQQQQQQTQQDDDGDEQQQHQQQDADQQCHICMHDMKRPSAVKGCGHRFCHACILTWVGSRQQPVCPVCRAEVTVLLLEDCTEQKAEPAAAPAPAEAEPDLSCLDHGFFLGEVSRLLSRAQTVHNRVYRDAYGCGRRGGASHHTGLMLDGVQDVMDTLTGYRSTLEGEVRFDPQVLLQELYRLDRQLTSLQAGNSNSDSAGAETDPWQQQAHRLSHMHLHGEHNHEHGYDDDYHEHDYDYDSADDDDAWHEGLSRTPGRRPTQRQQGVKHARNNSGGSSQQQSQQQQQQRQHQQLQPHQRGPMPRWRQGR